MIRKLQSKMNEETEHKFNLVRVIKAHLLPITNVAHLCAQRKEPTYDFQYIPKIGYMSFREAIFQIGIHILLYDKTFLPIRHAKGYFLLNSPALLFLSSHKCPPSILL